MQNSPAYQAFVKYTKDHKHYKFRRRHLTMLNYVATYRRVKTGKYEIAVWEKVNHNWQDIKCLKTFYKTGDESCIRSTCHRELHLINPNIERVWKNYDLQ